MDKSTRKALPGGRVKWWNLIRNWMHQAFFYMDAGEQVFRISLTLLLVGCAYAPLQVFFGGVWALGLSLLIVHTINWVLNGLFWSVLMFAIPGRSNRGREATKRYLASMRERLCLSSSISGVMIYGSLCRRQWHERSDADIRLLRKPGVWNWFVACVVTTRERLIAFLHRQPIDLYLADDVDFLCKMRSDERPLFLIADDQRLAGVYGALALWPPARFEEQIRK